MASDIGALQDALAASNEFAHAVLNSVDVENIVLDCRGHILAVNGPWRRFAAANGLALEKTACLDVGADYLSVCRPDPEGSPSEDGSAAGVGIRAVLAGTLERFELEYPCHSPTQQRWFCLSAVPLKSSRGGAVITHTDITGRKTAHAALRASQDELRRKNDLLGAVLANMPGGLCVLDADLRLLTWNAEYQGLFDLPDSLFENGAPRLHDVIRLLARRGDYGACDVEATVTDVIASVRASQARHFELRQLNGRTLEVRTVSMPDGVSVETFFDITARLRAQASARQGSDLLRSAIEAIDEAFVLFDPHDKLIHCNEKYLALFGGEAGAIVPGASFPDIKRAALAGGIYAIADNDHERWLVEFTTAHRSNGEPYVQRLANGRILRSMDRRMADGHTVGFRVDITELMRATEEAENALASKVDFIANVGHEIRTPLNAVIGMLALLRRSALDARQSDHASRAAGAAGSLLALLNQVLDHSKIDSGNLEVETQCFDSELFLRDLSVIVAAGVGAKPLSVRYDIDPALPRAMRGDRLRLQQVLVNLMGNAVKFTDAGHVVLQVRAEGASIGKPGEVMFSVTDTGIGIAREHCHRIFDAFTQAEASITRRFGGTGLGLSISQRLVHLMGGTLQVTSEPGTGSRFHFRIDLGVPCEEDRRGLGDPKPGEHLARPWRVRVEHADPALQEHVVRMGRQLGWDMQGTACDLLVTGGAEPGRDWRGSLSAHLPVARLAVGSLEQGEACWKHRPSSPAIGFGFLAEPFTHRMLQDAARAAMSADASAPTVPGPGTPSPRRLAGLRLLVAEDNPNNQIVAGQLLEEEGAVVQIAGDGAQALALLEGSATPVDAVLMDLQMPVMDGLTAARRIRASPGQAGVPIIAMTANATMKDRESCLAAGMNDHVGKPFDIEMLVEVLQRHARPAPATSPRSTPRHAAISAAASAAADRGGIDLAQALRRIGGNAPLYRRLLESFIADVPRSIASLQACVDARDPLAASLAAHAICGTSGALGLTALNARAAEAEARLASLPSTGSLAPCVDEIVATLAQAGADVRVLILSLGEPPAESFEAPSPPAALKDPERLEALVTLARQLRESDIESLVTFERLGRGSAEGERDTLTRLDAAIRTFDLDRAAGLCDELIEMARCRVARNGEPPRAGWTGQQ